MGQKVNPHGLRVGVIKNWDSRWFKSDKTFGDTIVSDYNIREYINAPFVHAVGGSWVCPKAEIAAGNFEKITQLCREARKAALEG